MRGEWRLVAVGLGVASLGAGATALYIVAASWLYVGRFIFAGLALAGAVLGAVAFRRSLGPYLDALDARADADLTGFEPVGGRDIEGGHTGP